MHIISRACCLYVVNDFFKLKLAFRSEEMCILKNIFTYLNVLVKLGMPGYSRTKICKICALCQLAVRFVYGNMLTLIIYAWKSHHKSHSKCRTECCTVLKRYKYVFNVKCF